MLWDRLLGYRRVRQKENRRSPRESKCSNISNVRYAPAELQGWSPTVQVMFIKWFVQYSIHRVVNISQTIENNYGLWSNGAVNAETKVRTMWLDCDCNYSRRHHSLSVMPLESLPIQLFNIASWWDSHCAERMSEARKVLWFVKLWGIQLRLHLRQILFPDCACNIPPVSHNWK